MEVRTGGPDGALAATPADWSDPGEAVAALGTMAGELSSALVQLPAEQVRPLVEALVGRVAERLGADRATFVDWSEDTFAPVVHFKWLSPGTPNAPWDQVRASLRWYFGRLTHGEMVVVERAPDDLPEDATDERDYVQKTGLKSVLAIPVEIDGQPVCGFSFVCLRCYRKWPPDLVRALRFLLEIIASALYRQRQERVIQRALGEVERLNRQLESENTYLREELKALHGFDEIVGDSAVLRAALEQVLEVAPTDSTVLLLGETGTGKELFARAIHDRSARRQRALISVNCAALPATLIESELFGHERGAFTGAVAARQGRFELADRGTLLLDEIGDLPLELQGKLLRVLQHGEFERLGSSRTQRADVRVVAATNRDLEAAVAEGRFRADLYYRLSVYPIRLPALRERPEDIPKLVWYFLHLHKRRLNRHITKVPAAVMHALQTYHWPGNVRELENVVERAMIHTADDTLRLHQVTAARKGPGAWPAHEGTLGSVERRHIEAVLAKCAWRINGAGNAAEQLGLHPNTLRFRMKKLGIVRPAAAKTTPSE